MAAGLCQCVEIGLVFGFFCCGGGLDFEAGGTGGVLVFDGVEGGGQVELGAGHGEIDAGQEFAVYQCAVQDTLAAVYFVAFAQGIEVGFLAGVEFFGHGEGVGNGADAVDGGEADTGKFGVEEADVEFGVVDDEFGAFEVVVDLLGDLGEYGFAFQRFERYAVDSVGFLGDVALGVDVEVEVLVGEAAVDHFETGKFDDAVGVFGVGVVKTGGFGVEDDLALAHGGFSVVGRSGR